MVLDDGAVKLRPLERNDLERCRAWLNDPQTAAGLLRVLPVSELEQERWFETVCLEPARMVWAIEASEAHVGNAGLYHIDLIHRRAELWCYIGEADRRGAGLGRRVCRLLLDYAFEGLGLNKVYVQVGANNRAALALYRGLGFQEEGRFAQEYYIKGRFLDVVRLGLLRSISEKE